MNTIEKKYSYKYLFGPVPSRRFGLSLGVDLVPAKTCPLNCVFCEVGPTTSRTIERKEYVPEAEVKRELKEWRAGGGTADFVTVTGSGEPTLHTGFGHILEFIKKEIKLKSALLTNSTLLDLPEVREAAALADVVKVTLSAADEATFRRITRPHPALSFAAIVEGLKLFRREYPGAIWLEVFIVPGMNSARKQIRAIAELARQIRPNRIQLNTAVRPTAEQRIEAAGRQFLEEISGLFAPRAEVIARPRGARGVRPADQNAVLAMLRRRPCTARDVAAAFALDIAEIKRMLRQMLDEKLVRMENRAGEEYFMGI